MRVVDGISQILPLIKILKLNFREKFTFRRGRVNCSLNDNGIWRWFGVQFSVNQN